MKKINMLIAVILLLLLPCVTSWQLYGMAAETSTTNHSTENFSDDELATDFSLENLLERSTSSNDSKESNTVTSSEGNSTYSTEEPDNENNKGTVETEVPTGEPAEAVIEQQTQDGLSVIVERPGNDVSLRDENEVPSVEIDWRLSDESRILVQFNRQMSVDRKIKIDVAQGVLIPKSALKSIEEKESVEKIELVNERTEPIYHLTGNLLKSEYYAPKESNQPYKDYFHGNKIVVHFKANTMVDGFAFPIRSSYGGHASDPSFWSGIQGDSLNRETPAICVSLVENENPVEKRILDKLVNTSSVGHSVLIKNNAIPNSQDPGPQLLDKGYELILNPRIRNNDMSPNDNSYQLTKPTYEVYLPYKYSAGGTEKYVSAELLTDKMDDWINNITRSNGGEEIFKYRIDRVKNGDTEDGRIKITYYFTDPEQDYLIQVLNLKLFYRYPSADFSVGDTIYYTKDNLGRTYESKFDGGIVKNNSVPLTDSDKNALKIVDDSSFDFAFLSSPTASLLTNPVINTQDKTANHLLGHSSITNKTNAKGKAHAKYVFDTKNTWNIGVTMVQFWTVDSAEDLAAARKYQYNFSFVLQKRGSKGDEDKLTGNYTLIPEKEYKNKNITHHFGVNKSLLGYPNERYYYYVNREMLAQDLTQKPVDFEEYYIKELSYTFEIAAKDDGNYISGDVGRVKESGGQYYGRIFTDEVGPSKDTHSTMGIEPAEGYRGNTLKRTINTRLVAVANANGRGADVGMFIDGHTNQRNQTNPMTITDSKGQLLQKATDRVDVGEKLTVKATALSSFYPYGATNYSPNPVFYIRTPTALTLLENSIKLTQNRNELDYKLEQLKDSTGDPTVLEGTGGYFYRVEVLGSDGLGYYNEERELIGDRISIEYQMEVNIASEGRPVEYRELLFVGDKKYTAAVTGSYMTYMVIDQWGLTKSMPNAGWANTYQHGGTTDYLCSTGLNYSFTTNSPNLNFGLGQRLSNDITDPNDDGTKTKGVLDQEEKSFKAIFSMDNIHQKGYVDSNGLFTVYLPIAKQAVKPEWLSEAELADFSLVLDGKATVTSQKGITYDIGYTTAQERFNNNRATFTGEDGFAEYKSYEEVKDKLDQITMIKIVGRANNSGMIVPFGEQMTVTVPLKYGEATGHSFEALADEEVSFRPYVVQIYTIDRIATMIRTEATKNSLRIRYRPALKEITVWGYNEADYPNDPVLNKTADIPLPNFVNQHTLMHTPGEYYSFNLDTIDNMKANLNNSVSYGNSTFAFGTGLNLMGADPPYLDLSDTAGQVIGTTESTNQLSYKIYNANNINDTLGERSLVIHYQSQGSDALDFKVKIKVLRKASKINVENALMAGKVYKEFSASSDNINKTLQDGALTVQYAYDTSAITEGLPEHIPETDFFLQFSSINGGSSKVALPPKDTILMKVQSKKNKDDKLESVTPEYYYYQNTTDKPQTKILLNQFYKMGENKSEATRLTKKAIGLHASEADQLSYLFIFDFENEDTVTHELNEGDSLDMIKLSFPVTAEEGSTKKEVKNDMTSFEIGKKTEVVQHSVKTDQNEYEPQEPIEVNGIFQVTKPNDAVDAFNQYKLLTLKLSLVEETASGDKSVDWPEGTAIQKKKFDNTLEAANYSRLKGNHALLIAPFDRVDPNDHQPGQGLPTFGGKDYKFKISTPIETLEAGKKYKIKVVAHKARSSFYSLMGEQIKNVSLTEDGTEQPIAGAFELPITIKEKPAGLTVDSKMKERLVYNDSSAQKVNFEFKSDNIDKIKPVLEVQKNGTTFEEVTDWKAYIETPQNDNLVPNGDKLSKEWDWELKFKDDLPAEFNGEYRIVFKAYREKSGDYPGAPSTYELIHEVPWSFAIWDPLPIGTEGSTENSTSPSY